MFFVAGLLAVFIRVLAMIALRFLGLRAALANPVESLRNE